MMNNKKGFTLIELLVVIGIIAVLAGVVIVALNPARQFAQANNTKREAHINSILNAIGQRIADNKGTFQTGCAAGALPTTVKNMADATSDPAGYDIGPCLVPTYLASMPFDPTTTGAGWTSPTTYNTKYSVIVDANGRVTVSAPGTQIPPETAVLSVTR